MKTIKLFSPILIWLSAFSSAFSQNYVGSGVVTKHENIVSSFNTLNLGGIFDIIIIPSNEEKIVVETDDNLHELVTIEHHDSVLTIQMKECTILKKTKGNIYIFVKKLTEINNSCRGRIDMVGVLKGRGITYHSNVKGSVFLNIEDTTLNYNDLKELFQKLKMTNSKDQSNL